MMRKRVKEGSAIFLALAVAFSVFALPGVWAANAIQVDRTDCSVEFSVGSDYTELQKSDVTIDLYKVASVDKSGEYTVVKDFKGLDVSGLSIEDKAGSAAEWAKRAETAAQMAKAGSITPKKVVTKNGTVTANKLETGLYLICPEQVVTDNYTYTFAPSMVSLPNNYYGDGGSDTWVYNLTGENAVTLKPEQHERFGDLIIKKTLDKLNTTSSTKATFVFQIDLTKEDGTTLRKVEAIDFTAGGTESVKLTGLPAGATVKVSEVYSGASYTLTSDATVETQITANDEYSAEGAPTAEVSFINKADGRTNGGYGVVNHFELDENGQYQYIAQEK